MATGDEIVQKVSEWKQKFGFTSAEAENPIPPQERSLLKGMFAGLVGGLAATAAKSFGESLFPPRTHGEPEPPAVLAEKIAGHPLDEPTKTVATESIHWAFGALTGAAYGGLVEFYPAASQREGASFGLALATLTHNNALPAMGLSAEPKDQTTREHTSEMATHIVYGVVTEIVRGLVRKAL